MVITEKFAWTHLPKAGGDATQKMLLAVPGLVIYAAPSDSNDKHDPFGRHEQAIEGKLRVMNLRRLPSFALSLANHRKVSGAWPDFEPMPLPSAEEMAESSEPDRMLRFMTDGPRWPVQRWLRTERLADDLAGLLDELGLLSRKARRGIRSVPKISKRYDHRIERAFSDEHLRRIYERNPEWAKVEAAVYGEITELNPAAVA